MSSRRSPQELRDEAAALEQQAHDSFERCDTDGALSQWASMATAGTRLAEAELAERGNRARFLALFNLHGELQPSWMVNGRYGPCFVVKTEWSPDADLVCFVTQAKRMVTYERKGFRLGVIERPARVEFHCSFVGAAGVNTVEPAGWDADEITVIHTGEGLAVDQVWALLDD